VDRILGHYFRDKDGKIWPRHELKGKGSAVVVAIELAVIIGGDGVAGVGGASSMTRTWG